MKKVLSVFIIISLMLFGCSSTTNQKEDNATSQDDNLKDEDTSEETETEENNETKEAEESEPENITEEQSTETATTKENNDVTSNANSSSSQASNNQSSVSSNPIVQAALKYRGSYMACDQLVTMALVDTGVITGTPKEIFCDGAYYNIGVYQFPALGTFISASSAQAGDLIYYDNGGLGSAHIAIYAGNGQAVHGGWNGNQVVLGSVNISGSAPKYMRFPAQSWDTISNTLFPSSSGNNSSNIPPNSGNNAGSTTYTSTITLNDITVTVTSQTPIDENFMWEQMEAYLMEEITYEQFVANMQAKGYTVV